MESLEDRRLLTAAPGSGLDLSSLALDDDEHRASSLIVQFKAGTRSAGSLAAHLATTSLGAEWELTPGMRRVELDAASDWAAALAAYQSDPNVEFAQPDHRVSLQLAPNDPSFDRLYGLDNNGQTNGALDADIDAPEAWDVTTGSDSTIVAVIDTGVDYRHPDLAANIWTNQAEADGTAGVDDDRNGYIDDLHGYDFVNRDGDPMDDHYHGTHVAGTIGAVGDNDIGVAGVNWQVQIMALKFLDASGGGYESDAIAALNYAVANGAVVSNNSWGGGPESPAFEAALKNAASKGHIFVAAAGNDGWDNDRDAFFPASYEVENVISVAATDDRDLLAWFSNYGNESVDLAAPGVGILSTFPTQTTPAMRDGGYGPGYATISGTSMATPHVTGVVALVRSLHPNDPNDPNYWSYEQVIEQILSTVDLVDGATQTITGGRLNAAAAVGNAPPDTAGPRIIGTDPANGVVGEVNHVRLRFNEGIDAATIGTDDVASITGPDGAIGVLAVVPVAGSNRQFDITFAPQTTLGEYSLVLGADIRDLAGNLLDQDRDGVGGEPDDSYTATFEISDIIGFDSFDVPKEIDNLNSLVGLHMESILSIEQDLAISDLNVQLDIWFPYDGDLEIVLESPRGTQVSLSAYNGGEGGGFFETIFDDEGIVPIGSGFAPFAGTYRPDESLAAFDGENARGDWTLRVIAAFNIDHFLDGVGSLEAWSLELAGDGSAPPPPPPPPPPPGNRAPVAGDDELQGDVNSRLAVPAAQLLANDTDPDGDPLSIAFVGSPVGGSVSLGPNQLVIFEPNEDFTGAASFQYIVSDGFNIAIGNVSVDIQPLFQFNNARLAEDVDGNGIVTANDALEIINILNSIGSTPLASLLEDGMDPDIYLDVKADNWVAANDALEVINYINANPRQVEPLAAVEVTSTASSATDAALLSLLAAEDTSSELRAATKARIRGAAR